MIRYDLECARGHVFDAWFSSSSAFEEQRGAGLVACPVCASVDVRKRLMKPAIPAKGNKAAERPAEEAAPDAPGNKALSGKAKMMRQMAREVHALVREKAEYVGGEFASEARRRHEEGGGKAARPIWGEASAEEARSLNEEGIEVMPLPPLPDEKN